MERKRYFIRAGAGLILSLVVAAPFVRQPMAREERNFLREEMEALDSAYKAVIDALVLGDMNLINPELIKVQDARERLKEAEKNGYRISLSKNQKRLEDFFSLDRQFHIDLEELSSAAQTGQKKVVRNLAHRLLDACVACHERFRK